ncbi:MAG: tripartite tricarboxylate transporter substrate binding protein [Proteobacteria bacterium]|nr:tripartite tricarboxylate transporter substrate binding protein [Burkholderiales bacterium]
MNPVRVVVSMTLLACAFGAPDRPLRAQTSGSYPVKSLRMVVPFAAGGSNDVLARLIGPRLTEALGQTVVVDNRPGAGSVIGSEIVARAGGDGYTLLLADAALGFALAVQGRQTYDPVRDFSPITLIGTAPMLLLVNTQLPVQVVKDYVAIAKQQAGKLTVGSGGLGGIAHLSSELVQIRAGIKLTHIAYKGAGPAVADLVGGHIQSSFLSLASAMPQVKAGKLRVIAVTGNARMAALPDVPTFAEQGLKGMDLEQWWGVLGPAGVPRPIVDRLHGEIVKALGVPEIRERVLDLGVIPNPQPAEPFRALLTREVAFAEKLVKEAGIKVE